MAQHNHYCFYNSFADDRHTIIIQKVKIWSPQRDKYNKVICTFSFTSIAEDTRTGKMVDVDGVQSNEVNAYFS